MHEHFKTNDYSITGMNPAFKERNLSDPEIVFGFSAGLVGALIGALYLSRVAAKAAARRIIRKEVEKVLEAESAQSTGDITSNT